MTDFSPTLLLAGPVLRRVTATSVSVWVATSEACTVTLDVYETAAFMTRAAGAHTGTVSGQKAGTGSHATVAVGTHLHIAVVTAAITAIAPDTICSYNITLDVTAPSEPFWSGQWDLGGLKLLDLGDPSDDYQGGLGYAEGHLPTFATAPVDVANLRLWHGSCFKMHGIGPSILGNLDDILSDALPADGTATKQRPHLLLLTGDQIYADDVATAVLPMLTTLGANLLGVTETIPVPDSVDGDVEVTQTNFPAGRRMKLIRATAGMTSDDADNHLIGFGEWAALYLLCWTGRSKDRLYAVGGSPEPPTSTTPTYQPAWPKELAIRAGNAFGLTDADDPVTTLVAGGSASTIEHLLTPQLDGDGKVRFDVLVESFDNDRTAVMKVGDDGDKVRRALANIPVLTICDDHEVTDDWFITGAWRQRVLASTLGRGMIRNALMAYVLFQGWGNTPDRFDQAGTPEAQFLALVPQLFGGGAGTLPDPAVCTQMDHLLGLDDPTGGNGSDNPGAPGGPTRILFGQHLDIAGARLVILDTRTHREYGTPNGPPGLLAQEALDYQLPITLTDGVPLLIVVSPAPVLGPRIIEEIVAPLGTRALDFKLQAVMDQTKTDAQGIDRNVPYGDLYLDTEFWSARPVAFERFLDRVTRCPQVVILAGDVHYAASYEMDYTRFEVPTSEGGVPPADPPPASLSSRVVHFTASAIRNAWDPHVSTITSSIGILENLEKVGFEGFSLGWHRIDPPIFGSDQAVGEARPLRARLFREPVVLPTAGWGSAHAIRPPEWMYRVAPLSDVRTDDVRFQDLATLGFTHPLGPLIPDVQPVPPDGSTTTSWVGDGGAYSVATELHADNVEGAVVTRTQVFFNNIGVVTFARPDPATLTVQMAVYFQRPHPVSDDEKPHPFVIHAASLAVAPLTAPGGVGG